MTATSWVSALANLIAWMRSSMTFTWRTLWDQKNALTLVARARLTCSSVGHRVRKSQNTMVSVWSNHSSAWGSIA